MSKTRLLVLVPIGLVAATLTMSANGSPVGAARLAAPGVSSASVSPKRIYDDDDRLAVTFTTTGQAGPGRVYTVLLFIQGPDAGVGNGCDRAALSNRVIYGGVGKTYTVVLRAGFYGFWCHGRASIEISTNTRKNSSNNVRILRTLKFRVLRAP